MVSTSQYDVTYKILVLGESNVGKTSLIHRFTDAAEYQDNFIATIGIDSCSKVVDLDGQKIRLQIWDTAGQERFRTLTSAYYRGAMGIMLVYDVTAEETFTNINTWLSAIVENATPGVSQLLVANKVDAPERCRAVTREAGTERAAATNLQYFETSAKEGLGVDEAFMSMAKLIKKTRKDQEEHRKAETIQLCSQVNQVSSSNKSSKCC